MGNWSKSTFLPLQTREVLDAMREDVDWDAGTVLRVDGGASQNDLLMQIQVWVGPL
jgi:glycerol kinase